MPKVSVLLPTYNTVEEHLRANIESILSQTFTDFELIILDDASTDQNVREVIESFTDPRIIFAKNDVNLGISPSRNILLDMARGEYLAVADHDDISLPGRLERQAAYLDAHPEVGVVGAWMLTIPKGRIKKKPTENPEIENMMIYAISVFHPVAMIRKSVLENNKLRYEEEFSPSEDYALFARLMGKTKFANIPEILLHYRVHDTNTTKLRNNEMGLCSSAIRHFVKINNPAIAYRAENWVRTTSTWKLFRFLPLLVVKHYGTNRKTYLLFGFLPLFTWKRRYTFLD